MEKISYLGLPNCYRLCNGAAELVVATDIGPRILRYSLIGRGNVLGEYPDRMTATRFGAWKPWGGHRLWAAPERMPETYSPDNTPVHFDASDELSIRLVQDPDHAGIQKEMTVLLRPDSSLVDIHHKITNRSASTLELAPWAITIMSNGAAILPLEPWRSHDEALLPAQPVVRWYFTDFADPRWTFGRSYIRAMTDPLLTTPQKIGIRNKRGWCAHLHAGMLFVKHFSHLDDATYPDQGCNNEVYVEGDYLELETLGPLQRLAPGEAVEHVEHWKIFADFGVGTSDESIAAAVNEIV